MHVPVKAVGSTVGIVMLFALLVTCGPANDQAAVRSTPPAVAAPFIADAGIPSLSGGYASPAASGKQRVDAAAASLSEQMTPSDIGFDARQPTLADLSLGMNRLNVEKRLGSPALEYDLPIAGGTVRMNEYDAATVGYDASDSVIYVEVSKLGSDSGLIDIQVGQRGKQAAGTLGLPFTPETRVLSEPVEGGTIKLDLEPSTQDVLSIKLIGLS
jgi:hypothetical protein